MNKEQFNCSFFCVILNIEEEKVMEEREHSFLWKVLLVIFLLILVGIIFYR